MVDENKKLQKTLDNSKQKFTQHDQQIAQLQVDLKETQKDLDIKFGSKTLLNFGTLNPEHEILKKMEDKLMGIIEDMQ